MKGLVLAYFGPLCSFN